MNRRIFFALASATIAFCGCGPKEEPKTVKEVEETQVKEQKTVDQEERSERKAKKKR